MIGDLPTWLQVVIAVFAYSVGGGITAGILSITDDKFFADKNMDFAMPAVGFWPLTIMFMVGVGVSQLTVKVIRLLTPRRGIPEAKVVKE